MNIDNVLHLLATVAEVSRQKGSYWLSSDSVNMSECETSIQMDTEILCRVDYLQKTLMRCRIGKISD